MWLVMAGWVASALVFSTFFMSTMVRLRIIGIASNLAFMSDALLGLVYGDFGRLYPINARPGETLFRTGDSADRLYLVQQGTVMISESGAKLTAGEVFGEIGLFASHGRRTATAICTTDCRLLTLPASKTVEACHQDANLAILLARLITRYVSPAIPPASAQATSG